eukprot:m.263869 g.263869  ORF g.263869 m.263869 type:complete len:225 (-) comp52769_c0_seq1:328-1002(-)
MIVMRGSRCGVLFMYTCMFWGFIATLDLSQVDAVYEAGDSLRLHTEQFDTTALLTLLEETESSSSKRDRWLVLFHTFQCLECGDLLRVGETIAEEAARHRDGHHAVGSVDCNENERVCSHFGVEQYAAIVFEIGSERYDKIGRSQTSKETLENALFRGKGVESLPFPPTTSLHMLHSVNRHVAKSKGYYYTTIWFSVFGVAFVYVSVHLVTWLRQRWLMQRKAL